MSNNIQGKGKQTRATLMFGAGDVRIETFPILCVYTMDC